METKNIWLIVIGVIVLLIIVLMIIPAPKEEVPAEGKLSADTVDIIPALDYSECMSEIQQTNPEMSDSDARDNCIAVDAVTNSDPARCEDIASPEIRQACFDQF